MLTPFMHSMRNAIVEVHHGAKRRVNCDFGIGIGIGIGYGEWVEWIRGCPMLLVLSSAAASPRSTQSPPRC